MASSVARPGWERTTLQLPDLRLGPLHVRWDYLLVLLGTGVVAGLTRADPVGGLTVAGALALAIAVHELGHSVAARAHGRPLSVVLQLTGGSSYVSGLGRRPAVATVLLAGPLAGLLTFGAGELLVRSFPGQYAAFLGGHLRSMALIWSVYQLLPFPPLDGGLLLRRVLLARLGSATLAWRVGWALGFAAVLLLVSLEPRLLEPAVWLTGMAVILGRAEAGYVRHVDAYGAWERGEHREVVRRVRALPDYLDTADQVALLELGVAAALEIEDEGAVEDLAAKLPAAHPSCVKAAEWLLVRDRAFGARLAEQALDALAAERVQADRVERDHWADLAFRLAIHEARALEDQSALGLLEQAQGLGFDDVDRLEHEPAFERVHGNPRWAALVDRMRSGL